MWSIFHYLYSRTKFKIHITYGCQKDVRHNPKEKPDHQYAKILISVMTLYWRARNRNFETTSLFCQKAEQPAGLSKDIQSPLLLSMSIKAKVSAANHRNGKFSQY